MESGQLRKLNLCYAGIQSLYWAGFAAIWAFLSVLLLYRGFSNSQIGTVSALALLMPLAVQPVLASLADRDRRFTSRRLAMALTGLLLLCAVGLWCSAGSMVVTAALYVLVGISLTATAPFHSAMAMELQQHGVALNYGLSRGLGSACYAASVLVLGVVVERYAPTAVLPVFAGEMLLLLLLTWRFRASRTMEAAAGSGPVLSVGQVLRRYPAYTWLLVGCALLMACHSATCTYMIHIVGKVGGSESMMGSALAVAAFLELPAMGLFSRVRRKVPLAWLLIFCAAFFVIRAGLFWAARSVPVLYLAAALDFFEYGIFIPATVYYVAEHIDPANQVKGQSLIHRRRLRLRQLRQRSAAGPGRRKWDAAVLHHLRHGGSTGGHLCRAEEINVRNRPEVKRFRPVSVSKQSFRHAVAFFRTSKSSEKWGSSSCRTPFPGFPHTPFRPVDEGLSLF